MKNIFLVIVLLFSSEVFSQENGAQGGFIHLSKVEKPPLSSDCKVGGALCIANLIESFLVRNITSAGALTTGTSGKTEITTKVIIDTLGQISWASFKGIPSETGKKLAERLKEMPAFSPGEHKGQKTNVIVDLITPFYFWEEQNFSSEAVHYSNADSKAIWHRCRNKEDEKCTPLEIQNWMNKRINLSKVKEPGFYAFTTSFALNEAGKVSRIAFHGGDDNLAAEIMNKLQKLPQLEPAKNENKAVATYFIIPITLNVRK